MVWIINTHRIFFHNSEWVSVERKPSAPEDDGLLHIQIDMMQLTNWNYYYYMATYTQSFTTYNTRIKGAYSARINLN